MNNQAARNHRSGRAYVSPVMFFLFLDSHISEVPQPIDAKLCHMIEIWLESPNKVGKFGGPPQKNFRGQNMQNFGRLFATSGFDREYLRNGLRYPNRNSKYIQIDSSCFLRNRSRELWSTNFPDLDVRLDPLKYTFWGYYISALRGCCAMKFLHALEIDEGYLAHTPTGTGVPPPKKFNREN